MLFRAQLRSTLWEDPLGQEMATHSSILTRKTPPPGQRSLAARLTVHGVEKELDKT